MPIGGFVVQSEPEFVNKVKEELLRLPGIEVYANDEKGNIVVVIESETSDIMEKTVNEISSMRGVLSVGLAYLHAEDEVEKIEKGEYVPTISLGNKKPH